MVHARLPCFDSNWRGSSAGCKLGPSLLQENLIMPAKISNSAPFDSADDGVVEAVVMLRAHGNGKLPTPAESTRTAENVLESASVTTGLHPEALTVLANINSFSVRAPRQFVDAISRSNDVESVMDNEGNGIGLIAPMDERPVTLGN
jgi:hypothetical protein